MFNQSEFDVRCEWGLHGIQQMAPTSDAVIVVDVFSFSTSVSVAVTRGATIFPFPWRGERAKEFAQSVQAECAEERSLSGFSLSPSSLREIPAGTRLVLPSRNGATLTLRIEGNVPTFAGCLRNSKAVAQAAARCGPKIAVVPAGEKWDDSDSFRPAFEDWVGAGAIIRHLAGSRSPEAKLAVHAFAAVQEGLSTELGQCVSGQELMARGFREDVMLAADLDVDDAAPRFLAGAFQGTE